MKLTPAVYNLIDPADIETVRRIKGAKLACKFVVIEQGGVLHLVFGLVTEYPYHANLIDRFCEDSEIATGWIKKPDLVEVYDDSVSIRGGGYIDFDPHKNIARFSGYSTAYGSYDLSDVRLVTDSDEFFAGYSVRTPG